MFQLSCSNQSGPTGKRACRALIALSFLTSCAAIASPYSIELDRSAWTTVETPGFGHLSAFDGDPNSRWASGEEQQPGQTFTVALGTVQNIDRLIMVTNNADPNNADYPRGYEVHTSLDGISWGAPVIAGHGSPTHTTVMDFVSQSAAYIRITQTGSAAGKWWSIFELEAFGSEQSAGHDQSVQLDTSDWTATASLNAIDANQAIDYSTSTYWTTGATQQPGQSFTLDMQQSNLLDQIVMVSTSANDTQGAYSYPRQIDVQLSQDGLNWGAVVASRKGSYSGYSDIRFTKQAARFVRFTQTGSDAVYSWNIHNLMVFGSEDNAPFNQAPAASFANAAMLSDNTFTPGSEISVTVDASDADGYVDFVSLYLNNYLVGQKQLPPYEWDSYLDETLSNLSDGTYVLRAEATDSEGAVGTATVTFVVNSTEVASTGLHPDIVTVLNRPLSSVKYAPNQEHWGDSYSVGDQCYCDTTFDHGIGDYEVDTDIGTLSVRQACDLLGPGPGKAGRPLYNDIQCGNGPSNFPTNDFDDEDFCPGQINVNGTEDERRQGCLNVGPKWKFEVDSTDVQSEDETAALHPDIVTVLEVPLADLPTPDPIWWGNSYSVGDQCYCDGALDASQQSVEVETNAGIITVAQACALVGPGPGSEGRPIYNDVQCGNGPGNGNYDELVCPGQTNVEGTEVQRRLGCRNIGPTWKIDVDTNAGTNESTNTNSADIHPDIVKVLDRPLSTVKTEPDAIWWGDSYSVGDQCFCETTYDHGIGDYDVVTPLGTMTVLEACTLVGPGPGSEGRPVYNDIQCGNGPSNFPTNDYDDEDFCPGVVNAVGTPDERRAACLQIGPTWKL